MATYSHSPDDFTALMTDNNAPSPNVVSASEENTPDNLAYKAFDHSNAMGSYWQTNIASTGWLKFDFGSGNEKTVARYTVSVEDNMFFDSSACPKTWTLQGSNDNSNWTTLDTQTDVVAWSSNEMRTYEFVNTTAYRYYRINVTVNHGGSILSIAELELMPAEAGPTSIDDVECSTEITASTITIGAKNINADNVECSSKTFPPILHIVGLTYPEAVICNTQVTSPAFNVQYTVGIDNVESSSEISNPVLSFCKDINASGLSSLTQITVPTLSKSINASNVESASETTVPSLSFFATLNATLPLITGDILGGHGGFVEGTLPCITAEIRGGAILEATLPMITAEITGKVGIVGGLEATLPKITASIIGKTETLGEIEAVVPLIRAHITGKNGEVGEVNATLPIITADIQGYLDLMGELDTTLPLIEAYITGTVERDTCTVLRFIEPEL